MLVLVLVLVLVVVIDPIHSRTAIRNYDYEADYEHDDEHEHETHGTTVARTETEVAMNMSAIMILILCGAANAAPGPGAANLHERSLAVLREALAEGKEWVKVHAAESLLWTAHPENVRDLFLKEQETAGPRYRIGVWRVLAQAAPDEKERQTYVGKIVAVFVDTNAPDRLHAAETLGKLGYAGRESEVVRWAEKEYGSNQAMARWILANSGNAKDEAYLAELLQSDNADARGCAAYALRFFKKVRPETYAKLQAAGQKEPLDSNQRANILSPWYLHAPEAERPAIRAPLLKYAENGTKDDKREMCAALGRAPNPDDVPVLTRLLDDPDLDARAGAAEALLRIERGSPK